MSIHALVLPKNGKNTQKKLNVQAKLHAILPSVSRANKSKSKRGAEAVHNLDLRGVACPMNFVKTRLYLDKMQSGETVTVILDDGEPVESVSQSVKAEGHRVLDQVQSGDSSWTLTIIKA